MKRFPFPLRYSIPVILLGLGGLLSLYSFQREIISTDRRNEENTTTYVNFLGDRTSGILEYLYGQQDGKGTDLIISQLGDEENLRSAMILNEKNQVQLSTRSEWQGSFVQDTLAADGIPLIEQVRQSMSGSTQLFDNRDVIRVAYPVPLKADPGEIRSSKIGIFYLEYELTGLKQRARADALQRSLESSLVLAALCTAVWFFFRKTITARASRLVEVSNGVSQGDLSLRAQLSGSDELAKISIAFDQMTTRLKESFKELEHRVEERTIQLQEAKESADRANRAKGEFLANMSHELRNPLNGILSYTYILSSSSSLTKGEKNDLAIIRQNGSRLLTLIDDVLELAKIETQTLKPSPEVFDLPVFLQSLINVHLVRAEHKGVKLIYEPSEHLPIPKRITADKQCIRRVLSHLLNHAIKVSQTGSVTLRVEAQESSKWEDVRSEGKPSKVDDSMPQPWTKIYFQVEDSGEGIPLEYLPKVFLPFEQTNSNQSHTEGVGLDLVISQKLVELLGASIRVQSTVGQGTIFEFEIECPQTVLLS